MSHIDVQVISPSRIRLTTPSIGTFVPKYSGLLAYDLGLGEVEALISRLQTALDDARNTGIVQVRVMDSYGSFAYRGPEGAVAVGDLVEVPWGSSNNSKIGKVVGLGRNAYTGPVKDIIAKLQREVL